jgi:diaminohydroxyphosphoribosylaminopyrimidine deaminase/5-amino-6-(5-phosphoribosylamino)uracil reductase
VSARDERDAKWMKRCLALARKAAGRTAPNPIVGCVIVGRSGEVLAEGYHHRAGEPHGEIDALAKLGGKAKGATLYVNLEPCNHQGRTGPCAPKVIASGVKRVVIGSMDPIATHAGGARAIEKAGIAVTRGVLEAECEAANRAFYTWARDNRPFVVLKAAATLDGRVATAKGESRWITGEDARREVHELRNTLDAVLVGVGTVLADNPRLNVREVKRGRDPVRVVLDSSLRTPPGAAVLPNLESRVRTIIACTEAAPREREAPLAAAGAEVWRVPDDGGQVDVAALCDRLAMAGITSVLVEGGPTVHASFFEADLVDEVRLYIAPMILGGHGRHGGPTWVAGAGVPHLKDAHRLELTEVRQVGADLSLTLRRARVL